MREFTFVTTEQVNPKQPIKTATVYVKDGDVDSFLEFFRHERKRGTFDIQLFDTGTVV